MKSSGVSIGDTATRFGVATHVLRHWEDAGLLRPERDGAGRRLYRRDDFVRIAAIQASQSAGLSLQQIATMFDTTSYGRHQLLEEHLAHLARLQAELEASRAVTQHALECSSHDLTTCPKFAAALSSLWEGTGEGTGEGETQDDGAAGRAAWSVGPGAARAPRRLPSSS